MSAIDVNTQRDSVQVPQSVVEGVTPATYGITPVNPAYVAHGRNARLIDGAIPTKNVLREPGDVNRKTVTKTREVNIMTYRAFLTLDDEVLLASVLNSPNGSLTPDESRSFVWSRNLLGTETFIQYLGCKPESVTITDDNSGYLVLEIQYSYKTRIEDTTGPTLGTGAFGTPITTTPFTHLDGGTGKFVYDAAAKEQNGYSVTVVNQMASQDENGSVVDLWRRPTIRDVTGTVNLFKKELVTQGDALEVTPKAATLVIDTGQITLTFTNLLLLPSGEDVSGDESIATIERKTFESDDLVEA